MRRVKIGRRSVIFRVPPEGRKVSRRNRQFEENKRRGNAIGGVSKSSISTVVKMNGITQCGENPCWKTPCANEGTCVWKTGDNFTCICRPQFTGNLNYVPSILSLTEVFFIHIMACFTTILFYFIFLFRINVWKCTRPLRELSLRRWLNLYQFEESFYVQMSSRKERISLWSA